MQDRESKFKRFSKGVVVYDKKRDSDEIKVTPIEELPAIDDAHREWGTEYDVELPDASGVLRRAKTKSVAYITATWLGLHQPHRKTSPDVIAGELVDIYRYSDSEAYYWDISRKDTRKTEHVVWGFSNSPNSKGEENPGQQYLFTISTKDKYIEIRTPDNDGELTTYHLKIDTKTGSINIRDGRGNTANLDSATDTWNIESNQIVNIKSTVINMYADRVLCQAPQITLDGDVTITGSMSRGGNSNGSTTIDGPVHVRGPLSTTGEITSATSVTAPSVYGCVDC